ncbi:FAD/NADP-binding domain-containing protein [Dacryopinax primogenitus]|uniref:FAD/NADP-binding domain-containing protein n=1 Tax=Dacryopinax primogenitus (strain DJM 731) TaxID=1858805 RepID=M5FYC1_DACPD|nr:FAD/NADP-binding domain-containing protein [Dacryopinax primogenitus]EJT98551.1 FAD/NADP-binding domain-containing protein [Dacryopinax primogenitus]
MSNDSSNPNIVILGAGGSGSRVAHHLSQSSPKKYNIILVDQRGYYIHWPAMIRMVVAADHHIAENALIPLDKNWVDGNGKLVVGKVESILPAKGSTGGEVVLQSGERIPYAILVLATGSTFEGPLALPDTKPETVQWAQDWHKRIDAARSIVLVGGGAVGAEMAGEIKDIWPEKKVTLVHGDRALLNDTYPEKFRQCVAQGLSSRGVEFLFSDYVDTLPAPGESVTTRNGKILQADLVIPTRGGKPNTDLIRAAFPNTVDAQGRVTVLPTLQIPGHPTVFAAGDITSLPEQKQVAKYPSHASLISSNILALTAGQAPEKKYKPQIEMILITNGKTGGSAYVGLLWGLMLGDWFARTMKSKELLVGMARKALGYS